jgi:hypothetical protein
MLKDQKRGPEAARKKDIKLRRQLGLLLTRRN